MRRHGSCRLQAFLFHGFFLHWKVVEWARERDGILAKKGGDFMFFEEDRESLNVKGSKLVKLSRISSHDMKA